MSSIRLVSLNIQRSKHLERVLPFLRERLPDVVALQEVLERDLPALAQALAAEYIYAPMTTYVRDCATLGVAIFSRLPIRFQDARYYAGDPSRLPELDFENVATWNNKNFPILYGDFGKDGETFRIATAHHTWTPDGKPTDLQRMHTTLLLNELETLGEFVLCGDFNAPRGGEIFSRINERYKDNIPPEYASSLDPDLHHIPGLELMVDGLFSTPSYHVSNVSLVSGISDHKAIVADIAHS